VKLNLGCGSDLRPGWLNVDCRPLYPEGREFLCGDLLALDGRVEDSSVERIVARDVLEYVPWREVDALLTMLGRKLRPGGVLLIRVPDGEQIARAFAGCTLSHHEAQRLLYGDEGYPEDTRQSLWTLVEVQRRLEMVGLTVERLEQRGMRLIARARRAEKS
jgi:predicted SAM-dependent methyltransferase